MPLDQDLLDLLLRLGSYEHLNEITNALRFLSTLLTLLTATAIASRRGWLVLKRRRQAARKAKVARIESPGGWSCS